MLYKISTYPYMLYDDLSEIIMPQSIYNSTRQECQLHINDPVILNQKPTISKNTN